MFGSFILLRKKCEKNKFHTRSECSYQQNIFSISLYHNVMINKYIFIKKYFSLN